MSQEQPAGLSEPEPTTPIYLPQPMTPAAPPGGSGGGMSPYAAAGPPGPSGSYAHVTSHRPRIGGIHLAIAWVMAILSFAYFLPWAVAASRQKSNTLAIALVNLLLGWTFVGWVVALVMACMAEPQAVTAFAYAAATPSFQQGLGGPAAGWYPDGSGVRQYWDGTRWTGHTAP